MSTLLYRRTDRESVRELVEHAPESDDSLNDEQRALLAGRFKAVGSVRSRRLDAWSVESAGAKSAPFRWTPSRARRTVGLGALRRVRAEYISSVTCAARDEIDELLVRAAAGYAYPGSLARWLADQCAPVRALVVAEAVGWATTVLDLLEPVELPWATCSTDAYYDVAAARTSLRARRDVTVNSPTGRVVVRFRGGQPGRSAGPGLRADLVVEALSHPDGVLAERIVGIWPDAGISLAVDGTLDDARLGARDLVRTAVAQHAVSRSMAA